MGESTETRAENEKMRNENDYLVKCPFFRGWIASRISQIGCEGVGEQEKIILVFRGKDDVNRWLFKYCRQYEWEKCPYAKFLKKNKYGLDGE